MDKEFIEKKLDLWRAEEKKPFSGWDFSYIKDKIYEESPSWNYLELIKGYLKDVDSLLDIGTGGGERLLELKALFPSKTAATEAYEPNFQLAKNNLNPFGVEVVKADDGLNKDMPFNNESFQIIINRHTAYNISEIERILKPGGYFITQQVSGDNIADLVKVFNAKLPWSFWNLAYAKNLIKETDLVVERAEEWSGRMIVKDIAGLVFFLKAIPWTVDGFTVDKYKTTLIKLQEKLDKGKEIAFTQKRFILIVNKK